jgi:Sigma-70, region 4
MCCSPAFPDTADGPEARYETREAVSLAFITALQLLPPRQRAALIVCDVLGFPVRQAAELLDTTEQSAASALKRARATLAREVPKPDQPAPAANSPAEQQLLSRLVQAFEDSDVQAVVALLTDDVWVRMPPSATAAVTASCQPAPTASPHSVSTFAIRSPRCRTRSACSSSRWQESA